MVRHPRLPACLAVVLLACSGHAAVTNTFLNFNHGDSILGANGWGGASGASAVVYTNGYSYTGDYETNLSHYVVYAGMVSNTFPRIAPSPSQIVSLQLLSQISWSPELPDPIQVGGGQAGICVSNGWPFVWTSDGWLRLSDTNTVDPIVEIPSNQWTKVAFEIAYNGGNAPPNETNVFYHVSIDGHAFWAHDSSKRWAHGSPFVTSNTGVFVKSPRVFFSDLSNAGVTTIMLTGTGVVDEVYAGLGGGEAPPLASEISIRATATTNGLVLVEFSTKNETVAGAPITLWVLRNGVYEKVGEVTSHGDGSYHYEILVAGLTVGESYSFKVEDEGSRPYLADGIAVNAFTAEMTVMRGANSIHLEWDSQEGYRYHIEYTRVLGGTWQRVTDEPIPAQSGGRTGHDVIIEPGSSSGFFRIVRE